MIWAIYDFGFGAALNEHTASLILPVIMIFILGLTVGFGIEMAKPKLAVLEKVQLRQHLKRRAIGALIDDVHVGLS